MFARENKGVCVLINLHCGLQTPLFNSDLQCANCLHRWFIAIILGVLTFDFTFNKSSYLLDLQPFWYLDYTPKASDARVLKPTYSFKKHQKQFEVCKTALTPILRPHFNFEASNEETVSMASFLQPQHPFGESRNQIQVSLKRMTVL